MSRELLVNHQKRDIFRDGDRIYKVFDADFPKDEVFHEAFINTRVECILGDMVPKVLSVTREDDGKWTLEKEYVPGETLEELIRKNPDETEAYLDKMLSLQLGIQSHRATILEQHKDKMRRQITELPSIDEGTRYELLARLEEVPRHEKLCHGDFCPANIIIDPDGGCHVIDWVHATKGNASADIARTYLIMALEDKKRADRYLAMFCERTATDIRYVQKWMPIIAAARLTKNVPEEAELLQSWLQICDHM